jgi:hypothetical protein
MSAMDFVINSILAGHHGFGPVGYGGPGVGTIVLLVVRFATRRHHGRQ